MSLGKASLIFSTKNISEFGYKVVKHLKSWPPNEIVKLTMLWTTLPWLFIVLLYIVCLLYIVFFSLGVQLGKEVEGDIIDN